MDLPKGIGTPQDLMGRFTSAKSRKLPWETNMRECYEYALPQRETFYRHTPGQKKNVTVYDDTAVLGTQKFASRLQSTLVPPWRNFSILAPGSEVPKDLHEEIQEQLDDVTKIIYDHINHSNFATQANECFLDLAIGTGAILCNEGEGDDLLDFTSVPLSELYLEEGPRNTIETVWRQHKVAANNIQKTWPGAELTSKVQKMEKDEPNEEIDFVEGVIENDGEYEHVVMEKDSMAVIFTQTYEVSPWVVPRWMTVPGEIYGRGPVMSLLPTIKTANKVKEFILRNAHLAIAGAYTGTDDGILNPYTVRIAPGIVIPVGSNDNANPSLRPLDRSGDFNVGDFVLSDLQDSIKMGLFNNMRRAEGPVKSATEIALDNKELVEDIGSSFGRLQTEFVEKVLKWVVYVLKKNGKIPEIKVDGKEITLKHTSPLAKAQDTEDLLVFQQYVETVSQLGPEVMMMGTKMEDVPAFIAKSLGVKQELIRTKSEREQVQQVAAQAMQQQAQQQ